MALILHVISMGTSLKELDYLLMASGLSCPARPLCPALSLSHPLIGMSRSINPSARPPLQINQQNMQNQNIIKDFIRVEHLHALWNNYVPE